MPYGFPSSSTHPPFLALLLAQLRTAIDRLPPANAGWAQVMVLPADLDSDGTDEIVALTETPAEAAGAQKLAVYKLGTTAFRLVRANAGSWQYRSLITH